MIASGLPNFIRIVCWGEISRRFLIIFIIVLGSMSGTDLLQHSKLNCTVYRTIIAIGLQNFIRIVCWIFFNFTFKTSFDFLNQNSIRAHVWHRAFETLQIELYRVVDYNSKWSTKSHKDCMLEFFFSLLRRLLIIKIQNSIRAHVWNRAFETLQIEVYRVVGNDRKWSTKSHKDCMLQTFFISLLRRLMIILLVFKIIFGPMTA